jgi:hypothetical protein
MLDISSDILDNNDDMKQTILNKVYYNLHHD